MSLGFASQTVGLPLAQCVPGRWDSVSVPASLRLRSHISGPSYTHVQIQYQGPKALSRDTSWHLSDWDHVVCGGRSCGSAERPDMAVLYGLRAGGLHGHGGVFVREEAATSCLPCTLGLADALCAFFFLLFPLLTRLSIFCLQCLFLITSFMIWPGIRF